MTSVTCHSCSRVHGFDGPVPRRAECEACGSDLHCCRSCGFYDESAYNDCGEPSAERVLDKTQSNFCDYFSGAGASRGASGPGEVERDTKSDLEKLFKK